MIEVKNLIVGYGGHTVLSDLSFSVKAQEVVSFIGPNGCGKSTLFRSLRGDKQIRGGSLQWSDGILPKHGAVEQNYRDTLLPWLSTAENICFPLRTQKVPLSLQKSMLEDLLHDLDVDLPLTTRAGKLSGGQAQLVTLLRALIFRPKLLFLDEPFSALDYLTKWKVRQYLHNKLQKYDITALLVSHDPEDCAFLSNKVIVLNGKPTKISNIIPIDLPQPRNFDLTTNVNYLNLQQDIIVAAYETDFVRRSNNTSLNRVYSLPNS